jgi:GTPase SAR1 family protein
MTISDASSAGRRASAPATQVIRLQIWDTAGEEKYRAMTRFYYRNCAAGLIVYDITNKRSFDKLDEWTREFRDHCPQAVILIAGNKSDRTEGRQVLRRDAENYAESRGLVHMEVRVCCVRVRVVCVSYVLRGGSGGEGHGIDGSLLWLVRRASWCGRCWNRCWSRCCSCRCCHCRRCCSCRAVCAGV